MIARLVGYISLGVYFNTDSYLSLLLTRPNKHASQSTLFLSLRVAYGHCCYGRFGSCWLSCNPVSRPKRFISASAPLCRMLWNRVIDGKQSGTCSIFIPSHTIPSSYIIPAVGDREGGTTISNHHTLWPSRNAWRRSAFDGSAACVAAGMFISTPLSSYLSHSNIIIFISF